LAVFRWNYAQSVILHVLCLIGYNLGMIEPKRHIGEILASERQRHGLTQAELAKRMGRDQTYIARVEGGKRDPRWETVLDFARALDLEPMLIPRSWVPAVTTIVRGGGDQPGEAPPLVGGQW
jgi:DNA-binding XRE family transcriptional regulator